MVIPEAIKENPEDELPFPLPLKAKLNLIGNINFQLRLKGKKQSGCRAHLGEFDLSSDSINKGKRPNCQVWGC